VLHLKLNKGTDHAVRWGQKLKHAFGRSLTGDKMQKPERTFLAPPFSVFGYRNSKFRKERICVVFLKPGNKSFCGWVEKFKSPYILYQVWRKTVRTQI
jgi:hypothetical protein